MNYNGSYSLFSADTSSPTTGLVGSLFQPYVQSAKDALPTREQAVEGYLGAVVAFWVIGGVTLYLLVQLTKGKR